MNSPVIAAQNLSLRRGGVDVLKSVSLDLQRSSITALIGPNGAGKTSLLLALAGLLPVSRGDLLVDGKQLRYESDRYTYRRRLAMVFQDPHLLDTNVAENVATGLKLRGVPRKEQLERVAKVLEQFGISGLEQRAARTLSSGEAKKVSLARAFALKPEMIFLDEPFTAMDLPVREEIFSRVAGLLHAEGITAVIATHDCREVFKLCNRVAILAKGRLVRACTPAELLDAPHDEFAAAFARHAGVSTVPGLPDTGEPLSCN